jgi:NitT/TauT family transport system substrate-binding protein
MLEDGMFTTESWLAAHTDVAERFIAASDQGWIYCRDHVQQCTNTVLKNGPTLGKGHQLWQMNEINKLIWPNSLGIGVMSGSAFKQTAAISLKYGGIKHPASSTAYTTVEAKAALQLLKNKVKGIDVYGKNYKALTVKIVAGGK